jgi:hypothetical protein
MDLDNPVWAAVFAYSEWLDADKGLLPCDEGDDRTHEDLVNEFFAEAKGDE